MEVAPNPKMHSSALSSWYLPRVHHEFNKVLSAAIAKWGCACRKHVRSSSHWGAKPRGQRGAKCFEKRASSRVSRDDGSRASLNAAANYFCTCHPRWFTFLPLVGKRDPLSSRATLAAAFASRSLALLIKCEGFKVASMIGVGSKHSATILKLKANGGESQHAGLATFVTRKPPGISSVMFSRTWQHFFHSGSVLKAALASGAREVTFSDAIAGQPPAED